jgi:cold shock CspA family protein
MNGIISMYHPAKRFGFILTDETKTEFFFHISNVVVGLTPVVGTRVSFELAPPIRLGQPPQAVKIQGGAL